MSRRKRDDDPPDEVEGPRVERRDSAVVLFLHEREVQVLQWVFADLARVVGDTDEVDAVTERLFPRAYLDPTEETAESDWQSSVHDELVEARLSALSAVGVVLEAAPAAAGRPAMREVVLDEAGTERWLGVLNDTRLALGTALGITADTDFDVLEPDDPRFEAYVVYDWLTHLLAALLDAASGPAGRDDADGDDGADDLGGDRPDRL